MPSSLITKLLLLTDIAKISALMFVDFCIVLFSNWLAYSLGLNVLYVPNTMVIGLWLVYAIAAIIVFYFFGLYRTILRYVNVDLVWPIVKAVTLYSLVSIVYTYFSAVIDGLSIPRSALIVQGVLVFQIVFISRYILKWLVRGSNDVGEIWQLNEQFKRVIIYGAGEAGFQLAQGLRSDPNTKVLGFIDDSVALHNHYICGLNVFAPQDIGNLVKKYQLSEVLLALPSASRHERNKIIEALEHLPVLVSTLPALSSIIAGKVKVEDIQEIDLADLVDRSLISPDSELMTRNIEGKTVLVTGAGGSIGSELCRQISDLHPKVLVLFEQSEFNLYNLDLELSNAKLKYIKILGSVEDQNLLTETCLNYSVETIFHAAAYKHVPLVECNPFAGVKNNILGTYAIAKVAIKTKVKNFVLISTDKAVNPSNIMGASKRFAELILQAFNHHDASGHDTRFVMVRFGNVLGSSGSAIPLFRKQIKQGGPVTLTHADITRYFMTIQEAAQLVIQAGAMGEGGDVFVLDMGQPIKIADLVSRMIHLSGLTVKDVEHPQGDIEIELTGLRPGEKLYEELLIGDNVSKTEHQHIMRANENFLTLVEIEDKLECLKTSMKEFDEESLKALFAGLIEGYHCKVSELDNSEKKHETL